MSGAVDDAAQGVAYGCLASAVGDLSVAPKVTLM